jgi:hypothetical protein
LNLDLGRFRFEFELVGLNWVNLGGFRLDLRLLVMNLVGLDWLVGVVGFNLVNLIWLDLVGFGWVRFEFGFGWFGWI